MKTKQKHTPFAARLKSKNNKKKLKEDAKNTKEVF